MAFPSTLSTFPITNPTDRLNSPSHSGLHNTTSSALGQVEAVIGVDGVSSVVGTMMYDLRSPASKGGGHVQGAAFGGTGQTNFNKGDMLAAQSASVLSKIAIGSNGYLLAANSSQAAGVQWVPPTASALGVSSPIPRLYTASSIAGWTKPSLLSHIIVEGVGGGGGGGGSNGATVPGAGGGGGGYSKKLVVASLLGVSENIVVGAAGAAGSGGNAGNGGTTVFGASSIIVATGGTGGGMGTAGTIVQGQPGGAGSNGDLNLVGQGSGAGFGTANNITGGIGGASFWGGGARMNPGGTGIAGGNYGGGGSGGSASSDGGAGAGGAILLTEYYI